MPPKPTAAQPPDALDKPTSMRFAASEKAIIARIRARHPYLRNDVDAIRYALVFTSTNDPTVKEP